MIKKIKRTVIELSAEFVFGLPEFVAVAMFVATILCISAIMIVTLP